ncbi:DUF3558 domain-containing protein [Sciscionella marina]|uniref:DUF3558 domain-containing protein n=1 Tax=Sciscionella marina TaxID=508770 RepID=UPI0009FD37BA|nr:DUF3558 domain-containing protein [Sciscionella marina]
MTARLRTAAAGVSLAAITLFATSCSSPTVGKPGAGDSPSSSANSGGQTSLPHDGAPKVPNPVDISKFKAQPCTTLTANQLQTLGVQGQAKPDPQSSTGSQCTWGGGVEATRVNIVFVPNSGGLSDLYKLNKQKGHFYRFEPQDPVNGFPAVLENLDKNQLSNGICAYDIGMNDRDAVTVLLQEQPGGNPCDDVKQVALSATKTMKNGGS